LRREEENSEVVLRDWGERDPTFMDGVCAYVHAPIFQVYEWSNLPVLARVVAAIFS
jgi:hypothetical protein